MSGSDADGGDSGPGRREVAGRVFAAEFEDATLSYSESDEERAPNYVVTPGGARLNRLFVVGVLTEVEEVSEGVLRGRVVDPTGAFVLYAGQYQPDERAFLERADPPLFVAVTGKARTFQPDDADTVYTSVRPESISEVDADTRDRWVVDTAEHTLDRVARTAAAARRGERGDALRATLEAEGDDPALAAGIARALDHYGTTGTYLAALRDLALDAARVVAGETEEVDPLTAAPEGGDDAPLADLAADAPDSDGAPAATPAADPEPTADAGGDAGTADADPAAGDTGAATTDHAGAAEAAGSEPAAADEPGQPATTAGAGPGTEPAEPTAATDDAAGGSAGAESGEAAPDDPSAASGGAADAETGDVGEFEPGEFEPGEFELDEEEREEIESEYGTEFQSGTEVDEPGEADIETPDPEDLAETEAATGGTAPAAGAGGDDGAEPASDAAAGVEPDGTADPQPEPEAEPEPEPEPAGDGAADEGPDEDESAADAADGEAGGDDGAEEFDDLEDAVVDLMGELDDGDGVARDVLTEAAVERYGVEPGEVEDAVQDALMSGRCYEPDETSLKPI